MSKIGVFAVSIISFLCTSFVKQFILLKTIPYSDSYSKRAYKVSKKYRKVLGIGIGFFRRYRYLEIDPIPDTSSTRYRFRPITLCLTLVIV